MGCPEIAVGGLILNKDDELLLVRSPKWNNEIIAPGGHVEPGESFSEALKREMVEETGLDVDVLDMVDIQEHVYSQKIAKDRHFIFLFFLCRALHTNYRPDNFEATEPYWVKPEDALKMNELGYATKCAIGKLVDSGYLGKYKRLAEITRRLRRECPWDAEQSIESMTGFFLDEADEVKEALDKKDFDNMSEEIGDVLTTLLFLIRIAEEKKLFTQEQILDSAIAKMIRRHPHVFGELRGRKLTTEEILDNWKKIKESGG